MKPVKEKLLSNISSSFRVKHSFLPLLDRPWHYHEEYELFYVIKGSGKRFIGDKINDFIDGDLVFVGKNLPHVWKNNNIYYRNKKRNNADVIGIQFKENFLGESFFKLPEMNKIKELLVLSRRGIKVYGAAKNRIVPLVKKITKEEGIDRVITLLRILSILSVSKEIRPIASKALEKTYFDDSAKRIDKVFSYVNDNFSRNIKLAKAADIAGMAETAFCRFFKQRTLKTFFQYVIEIRLGRAGRMLLNGEKTVSEISRDCGFQNVSYFIRQFKKVYGVTPLIYREKLNNIT